MATSYEADLPVDLRADLLQRFVSAMFNYIDENNIVMPIEYESMKGLSLDDIRVLVITKVRPEMHLVENRLGEYLGPDNPHVKKLVRFVEAINRCC